MSDKVDIKSLNYDELTEYITSIGEKKFRASQLYSWMHEKLADSYDEMTNISDKLKNTLKENTLYTCLEPVRVQESKIDGTKKYLFKLYDGNLIESVLMKYHHGNAVCISSQVGCKMGCRFCASTLNGCVRNLTPSEMLDQVYRIQKLTGERVSNIVIMGSGEPMDNYDNVVKFLELINSEKDKSELLMIVDLERNDFSKVCKPGTVKVKELFALEEYATVFHLVSTIEGELQDDVSAVKVMKECFPGGSITGAPKIRAMEIIEELEGLKRNIYTGAIGYFDFRGNSDFNIDIRTILKKDNKAYFGVGGGITY